MSTPPLPAEFGDVTLPLVVVAFSGWADAGFAASYAAEGVADRTDAVEVMRLAGDAYYDLQVFRPTVVGQGATRRIEYPSPLVRLGRSGKRSVAVVTAPEPSHRWQDFARDLAGVIESLGPSEVVVLGAMSGYTPHSRPVPVSAYAITRHAERAGLVMSTYEGPTGIGSVLALELEARAIPAASIWATIPSYAQSPEYRTAAVAILGLLSEHTGLDLAAPPDLLEQAEEDDENVRDALEEDAGLAAYANECEREYDAQQATGDAIASEFERYLRRRDEDR